MDQEKLDTNEKHKRLGNKSSLVQKEDLAKESVDNAIETCVDNNPLLGLVDNTKLKTIVDGEVISTDTLHLDDMGAQGNKNLSVSTEERSKKAIHEVFGSNSSDSAKSERQREHYPDLRLVGSWSDAATKSNDIVTDDNLNPNVAHNMEIMSQYIRRGKDAINTPQRVYIDEEERVAAINYLRNRSAPTEDPFIEVVSKGTKKNFKKGFYVHNTRYRAS